MPTSEPDPAAGAPGHWQKNDALFHPDTAAAETKRALLARADRKVLLLDDSKFQANGLYHVADLADFNDVVVNAELHAERRERAAA
ncbi:hypothetical protein [Cryobacterium aureum]|uniref:hypothetical protein n=1 Tax=Cryobacterium aureum TaxID=995037 RepID=UPI0023E85339|nr:hypothetical protein [Cryobacterium aureum]